MSLKTAITSKEERRHLKQRLSEDVHVILSGCIHQFDEETELDEVHFNVDGILAGRTPATRQLNERRTGRRYAMRTEEYKPYATAISRGTFMPHKNLFNSIVQAHAIANA